jgi:hypothetical protein
MTPEPIAPIAPTPLERKPVPRYARERMLHVEYSDCTCDSQALLYDRAREGPARLTRDLSFPNALLPWENSYA